MFERTHKEARERKKFERVKCEEYEEYKRLKEIEEREEYERIKEENLEKAFDELAEIASLAGEYKKLRRGISLDKNQRLVKKAKIYVRNENLKGHECYNGIKETMGEPLWIVRKRNIAKQKK